MENQTIFMNETIYQLLLWIIPILLGILSFVGVMMVNWLKNISKNLDEMNVKLERLIVNHDNLENRVEKLERKIFN